MRRISLTLIRVTLVATVFLAALPALSRAQTAASEVEKASEAGRGPQAEKELKATIREAGKSGRKDLALAETIEKLALLYRDQKKYSESEALYTQSLRIKQAILGPWDLSVAATLDDLAAVIVSEGRRDRAEPLDKRAHEIRDRALATHPDIYVNGERKEVIPQKTQKAPEQPL